MSPLYEKRQLRRVVRIEKQTPGQLLQQSVTDTDAPYGISARVTSNWHPTSLHHGRKRQQLLRLRNKVRQVHSVQAAGQRVQHALPHALVRNFDLEAPRIGR